MSDGEFSVWIFFPDGTHIAEAQWIDAKSAVLLARDITNRPAATIGIIERVVIADGGDFTVFEWTHDKGVTWPEREVSK